MNTCLCLLALLLAGCVIGAMATGTKAFFARLRATGRLNMFLTAAAVAAMVAYGGSKPPSPQPPGPGPSPVPPPGPVTVKHRLYTGVTGAAPALASEYNGYLFVADGVPAGTIQVKVGRPNARTGLASVRATVQLAGERKLTLKGAQSGKALLSSDGPTSVELVGKNAEKCTVELGMYALGGSYGEYGIDGARNLFTSKDKAEKSAAEDELAKKWTGAMSSAWDGGALSASVARRGRAKVSGFLADGTRVSANGTLLVGDKWCCVPVVPRKAVVSCAFWVDRQAGADVAVEGLGDSAVAGRPGELAKGAVFEADADSAIWSAFPGSVLKEYLPSGVDVVQDGARWTVAKPGKVVYERGTTTVDVSKLGDNPAGVRLTFRQKDGTFRGSFKVYSDNGSGRLKATTVSVTGVVVDGEGFGTAFVRKYGAAGICIAVP
ncbi:MAG: hypothetical protein IJI73_03160 [Kiritimatiellae bacterium]|nr:hypothetical protein [Kiritimatiellia bacterium]